MLVGSPSAVLTLGLGPWASASLLLTGGFGIAAAPAPDPGSGRRFAAAGRAGGVSAAGRGAAGVAGTARGTADTPAAGTDGGE